MEPKIVKVDPFMVIGPKYEGKNEHGEIGEMWSDFNRRWNEVPNLVERPTAAYGLCYMRENGEMEYIAGRPVTSLKDVPQGMTGREVAAQIYAVFEAKGVGDIMATYGRIFEWLPSSGYQRGSGPDYEYYPPDFDPENANESPLYIYFPVTKA